MNCCNNHNFFLWLLEQFFVLLLYIFIGVSVMSAINQISSVLASKFVNSANFAEAISLSLVSDIPVIFHGKGGYGKTEMILEVFKLISSNWGMLECTPETSASDIYGGAVAKTTKHDNCEITKASVNIEESLLNKECFFLEEMLDASFNALAALKSLITLKGSTLDGKFHESQCKALVAATNINPSELLESLPDTHQNSYEALLQRFLLVNHEWTSHDSSDYFDLLDFEYDNSSKPKFSMSDVLQLRKDCKEVIFNKDIKKLLSQLASKSSENGKVVSPRNLMWAKKLLQSNAIIRGDVEVSEKDMEVLSYINAFDVSVISDLEQEMQKLKAYKLAEDKLNSYQVRLEKGYSYWNNCSKNKHFAALTLSKEGTKLEQELNNSGKYPDGLEQKYKQLKENINEFVKSMKNNAESTALSYSELSL